LLNGLPHRFALHPAAIVKDKDFLMELRSPLGYSTDQNICLLAVTFTVDLSALFEDVEHSIGRLVGISPDDLVDNILYVLPNIAVASEPSIVFQVSVGFRVIGDPFSGTVREIIKHKSTCSEACSSKFQQGHVICCSFGYMVIRVMLAKEVENNGRSTDARTTAMLSEVTRDFEM
jgi:hypothetical protein